MMIPDSGLLFGPPCISALFVVHVFRANKRRGYVRHSKLV